MSARETPVVAIVGRPNVGKSTLFNRIIGERRAIVHDQPGLTRDRHYGRAEYRARPFVVIDTGGYEDTTHSPMLALMREQTLIAIGEADAIVFLTEESISSDPIDQEIIERLRASGKPFFLAVNKSDDHKRQLQAIADFSIYGLDQVYPISALHGDGVFDLLDDLTADFPEAAEEERDVREGPVRIAIVGRVNVGKSTLTNRLLGQNRVIASEIPGTTRDAIDTPLTVEGEQYVLIDTAGIRRRGKIQRGAEKLSVHSSFRAIDRADVALLLLDAAEGVTQQDEHVAGYIHEAGKACVIVLNKWDAVTDRDKYGEHIKRIREEFGFLKWAPIITISALTGQRAWKLWGLIRSCAVQYRREFTTRELNEILARATTYHSPPVIRNRQLKIKYVTQTGYCPPTLTFFVNDPKLIHFSYERYLQNQFHAQLAVEGAPLRFRLRRKAEDRFAEGAPPRAPRGTEQAATGRPPRPTMEEGDYEAGFYEED